MAFPRPNITALGLALALALITPLAVHAHTDSQSHATDTKGAKAQKPAAKEQKLWGIGGEAKAVTRTIDVRMSDSMRFTPDRLVFKQGETVRLRIRNDGKILHEFVLGTRADLDAHAAMMQKFPGMEHDEPYMAHVAPGRTGEIIWTFNRAGDFDFACLIAGHYQAGMVGSVRVIAANKP